MTAYTLIADKFQTPEDNRGRPPLAPSLDKNACFQVAINDFIFLAIMILKKHGQY